MAWLARNGLYLVLLAALFVFLYSRFGTDGLWTIAKVALGLGFVIFIHELGHFLVAKWCDVHVETFSIGFGPAIPGCVFRWGETTYMIALFPLGGYVKMVGEGAENDDSDQDPRSYKNKSVWQRMAIISAGVLMNVLLACVCFIGVYMTRGVERPPGVVGLVDPGSPAWQKGVRSGAVIHQIGNYYDPYFDDLMPEVMGSQKGQQLPLVFSRPGEPPRSTWIEPRRDKRDTRPMIGVAPPQGLSLPPPEAQKEREIPVYYQLYRAVQEHDPQQPRFQWGDTIIGTTDPDQPDRVKELPLDPRDPECERTGRRDFFEFQRRLALLAGKEVTIRVRRYQAAASDPPVDIRVPPTYHWTLGLHMRMGPITAVRENSDAAKVGVLAGDVLQYVEVPEASGGKTHLVFSANAKVPEGVTKKAIDPARLPYELAQWAERLPPGQPRKVTLSLVRPNPPPDPTLVSANPNNHALAEVVTLTVHWDDSWKFDREVPINSTSPLAVAGLGIAYKIETTVEAVEPGSPAAQAGIKAGDVVQAVLFRQPAKEAGQSKEGRRWLELQPDQWAHVSWLLQEVEFKEVKLRVEFKEVKPRLERSIAEVTLTAQEDRTWPSDDRGLFLMADRRLQKADHLGEAVVLGMQRTYQTIVQIYQNLRGLITGRVSVNSVGGPILIATVAYSIAGENLYQFIMFLGMISVNLAVINFLPIPVLDGGHMVFLIYEKLRGKPASERVLVGATLVGLALIISLMLIVTYLDVTRL
jgi:regulator of sigma E protease